MRQLKTSEIAAHRAWCVLEQNGMCALCAQSLALKDAVLDHRHKDGHVRQAIHRFCNTFLGKIENGVIRNRITPAQLEQILARYQDYVSQTSELLHPTFKTPEQKIALRKKRAQLVRKRKKL